MGDDRSEALVCRDVTGCDGDIANWSSGTKEYGSSWKRLYTARIVSKLRDVIGAMCDELVCRV